MKRNIYLFGASGKMGQCVQALLDEVVAQSEDEADAFLDFSAAAALQKNVAVALQRKRPLVVGTTGHGPEGRALLLSAAKEIPVFFSANFSLGIAAMVDVVRRLKGCLPQDVEIEMCEEHHASKRDAPSGTALRLAQAVEFAPEKIVARRGEKTAFEHVVRFRFGSEVIEVKHEAFSRAVFAQGALRAVDWIMDKEPGLYGMEDLLGEKG